MRTISDTALVGFSIIGAYLLAPAFGHAEASQQQFKIAVDEDGTVHIPAFAVPPSSYFSAKTKQRYIDLASHPPAIDETAPISKIREATDNYFYRRQVELAKALYPVKIEELKLAGVRTYVVTPRDGVSVRNRDNVLINLHGGGFSIGAGLGQLAESIPIASVGKLKVVSVDYRMAPEYKFPAASEDVAGVYRELLKRYKPKNIGIYGCSAGGLLTAEAVAWFQKVQLPKPGAVGIFCVGADAAVAGNSRYMSAPLDVGLGLLQPPPASTPNPPPLPLAYFSNADLKDPLASPAVSLGVLSKFPPTLLITGSRDTGMSSVLYTHSQLVKAGAEADLHVWDGMWHGFFVQNPDLPESKEAYNVIADFFDKHLN